ncbi:carbamoyltransferase [Flavitalea sp. BT771]|uniref:carbamoyltransferase family protein n=1 Tax=Flavitalea sp. BT771 TaxID=3063329 RepID=UPI0026E304AD|nr:carbamoyltransferase [Flavitalea sp. BT771]MDO6435461.1 carbamoyltransferase [Flavitalea sp. BT771]MDV6224361.1 carbamoyltransferase [Flavitalea sp. BT771]
MGLNIIGISAFYHDSACCILRDGVLIAAAQEERFSRIKADASLPCQAFLYCLKQSGLAITDIDLIAYYEDPEKKASRQIWSRIPEVSSSFLLQLDPGRPEREIREVLGYEGPIRFVEHHMSHAASSFFFSGFDTSAILTVDGVGEWATTTYGAGNGNAIHLFEEVHFPHSLGLLYSTITSFLGFGVNDGEYKVMGLAPYGKPLYVKQLMDLLQPEAEGQYKLNMGYFDFLSGERMFSDALPGLLGHPARRPDSIIAPFHKDLSKSLQVVLEEMLLEKARYLHRRTGEKNLCMAGGVALNCVANGRILRDGPFEKLFVQPASNDAGGAIGAAMAIHAVEGRALQQKKQLDHVYFGPEFAADEIEQLLKSTSLQYHNYRGSRDLMLSMVAGKLAEGLVIGWFQGRMEFGPRSLGARSILADPRNATMRDRINAMVKKREGFRPFAPAVLEDKVAEHFQLDHPSPFMLETCQVSSTIDLPAITHVDGSARVQTVNEHTNLPFALLIREFEKLTGCPILLNTSFNVKGEPIVCSPEDALKCFIKTDIDCLVMDEFVIIRSENSLHALKLILENYDIEKEKRAGIRHDVYTFV